MRQPSHKEEENEKSTQKKEETDTPLAEEERPFLKGRGVSQSVRNGGRAGRKVAGSEGKKGTF